ncbi:processed acidic surface protein [Mesobacillus foraminis]|uniref:processed acidic surface protein n=1 Tax=Mesobacillus foraminis TaxID=279826 RepID=UPI001BE7221C|nr:processed acidic surface protein [Mesobacillus foraminis]MBT2758333.1 processed acidic surface protein [Mesobacillus foraminis]
MNKILSATLAAVLVLGLFPLSSFALAPNEAAPVLNETGWTADELDEYLLEYFGYSLEEVESINELQTMLGVPLTEEILQQILVEYEFANTDELTDYLTDYGLLEEGDGIIETFFYTNTLRTLIEDYQPTPLTDETLAEFLADLEITREELNEVLAAQGQKVEDFETIEELEEAYFEAIVGEDLLEGMDEVLAVLAQFGITEAEVEVLFNHFDSINISDPKNEAPLMAILERTEAIGDFESADDLTDAELQELASIMRDMLTILQLDAKFYLTKDGNKTPLSDRELIELESTDGADLLIELYNLQGVFLADMIITAEMFGSEIIEEVKDEAEKVISQPVLPKKPAKPVQQKTPKTVKGAKMPNTAGNYAEGALLGLGFILGGLILIRRRYVKPS